MLYFSGILDLSTVYGSNNNVAKRLRSLEKGLLKTNMLGPTLPTRAQGGYTKDENGNKRVAQLY